MCIRDRTHIAWLIPIVVALVGFGGRFFFEVYDISKPGAFFGVMVTAMGASTSIPLAKIPFMSGCMLLGIGFSILFALVLLSLIHIYVYKRQDEDITKD